MEVLYVDFRNFLDSLYAEFDFYSNKVLGSVRLIEYLVLNSIYFIVKLLLYKVQLYELQVILFYFKLMWRNFIIGLSTTRKIHQDLYVMVLSYSNSDIRSNCCRRLLNIQKKNKIKNCIIFIQLYIIHKNNQFFHCVIQTCITSMHYIHAYYKHAFHKIPLQVTLLTI